MSKPHIPTLTEPELDAIAQKAKEFRALRHRLRREEIADNRRRCRFRPEKREESWESP